MDRTDINLAAGSNNTEPEKSRLRAWITNEGGLVFLYTENSAAARSLIPSVYIRRAPWLDEPDNKLIGQKLNP